MVISAPNSPNIPSAPTERPGTPHPGVAPREDTKKVKEEEFVDLGGLFSDLDLADSDPTSDFAKEVYRGYRGNVALPDHVPAPPGYSYSTPFFERGHFYIYVRQQFNAHSSKHHFLPYGGQWVVGGPADPFETANLVGHWVHPIGRYPHQFLVGENAHSGPAEEYPRVDFLRFGSRPPSFVDLTLLVYALELERNIFRQWVREAEDYIRFLRGYQYSHTRSPVPHVFFLHPDDLARFHRNIAPCLDPFIESALPIWPIDKQYNLYDAVLRGEKYPTRYPEFLHYGPIGQGR